MNTLPVTLPALLLQLLLLLLLLPPRLLLSLLVLLPAVRWFLGGNDAALGVLGGLSRVAEIRN